MSLFSKHPAPDFQLADLLEIENVPDILQFCCPVTNIPIWTQVRAHFLRTIMGEILFSGSASMYVQEVRNPSLAARTLARSALHNASMRLCRRMRSDVLLTTEAIGDQYVDGKWHNRYVDPFAELRSGQALVLSDLFEWNWHFPRHNPRQFIHATLQAAAALRGRGEGVADRRAARELIALAVERALGLLGWEMGAEQRRALESRAARKMAAMAWRYRQYRSLLKRVQPRVLITSSACYGFIAPLIAAARDLEIATAEYQHGSISDGHDAYNYAKIVHDSPSYRRTLPDYLLTYGRWWGDHVNVAVEKVVVGYPARAMKLANMSGAASERRTVLLLSDGLEFELYLQLARDLAKALRGTGLDVVIRPHPLERSRVRSIWGGGIDGIVFDESSDIYAAFRTAHSVVSEVSTGLFEAIGLVDRIIMLDSAKVRFTYPRHPFACAGSIEELIALVREPDMSALDPQLFWAEGWRANYHRFLRDKAGI